MKQFKNAMLAVVGGLVMLSVGSVSCSKDNNNGGGSGTPAPTITSFTPTTGGTGTVVTITGTNLGSATSVKIGGVAATIGANTATSIAATVTTGATGKVTVTTAGGTATSTADFTFTTVSLPTSNDVAADNLIAHWTFDTDAKEAISTTNSSSAVGLTFTAGRIGNAATLTNGYILYPPIHNIDLDTALQSYTTSMWVKMPNSDGKWKSLFQINANAYTNLFGIVGIQALNQKSLDTLALQITQTQMDGNAPYVHTGGFGCGGCFNSDPQVNLTNPLNYKTNLNWTLITVTYNGNGLNQKLIVYGNGVALDSLTLSTVNKPSLANAETFRVVPTGGTGAGTNPAGWHNYVSIGTFNWKELYPYSNGYDAYAWPYDTGRQGYMDNGITGQIDDIRVFNRPLTKEEVLALYTAGSAGR